MATRALLPNIQLARARVKPQPRGETQRESEYRDTLQNIAATLGVIGQGVNLARATEPWWAAIGYEGADTAPFDAKLGQQLAKAYQSQTPQQAQQQEVLPVRPQVPQSAQMPQTPQGAQMPQEQAPRMESSIMNRADRRGFVETLPLSAQTFKPSQGEPEQVRFNRMVAPKREKMFVRNDQDAVRGGAGPLRQEWDELSVHVGDAEAQRRAFGDPLTEFPSEQAAIEAANQLRFDQTIARRRGWAYAKKVAEANIAADEKRQQDEYAAREAAKRQGWDSARKAAEANIAADEKRQQDEYAAREAAKQQGWDYAREAAEENIADAKQQKFFDAAAAAVPQESLPPPPPPADPVQRQAELQNIAKETASPAAAVAAEIDRYSSIPVYTTFRETQARLASAVMDGDVNAAKLILQGAARSPMTDVRPTTLSDRLSGAHVRRAMTELTGMTSGMAGLQQRANAAAIRADLAERRLVLAQEKEVAMQQHRAAQREQAQQRMEIQRQRAEATIRNIDSMIGSRGVNDRIKVALAPAREALMRGQTATAYAIARDAYSRAKDRDKQSILKVANMIGDLQRAHEEAGGQQAGLGEQPTLANVPEKIKRGERIAPSKVGVEAGQVEVHGEKKAVDTAVKQTEQVLGLGQKGRSSPKDSYTAAQKSAISRFNAAVRAVKTGTFQQQREARAKLPSLRAMVNTLPEAEREQANLLLDGIQQASKKPESRRKRGL